MQIMIHILDNGLKIENMDKDCLIIIMEINMMDNYQIIKKKGHGILVYANGERYEG